METNKILLGNNLDLLRAMPSNSVDSVVTDPPYGISFMNKKWDYDVPPVETWEEVLRVLKPGGHILCACGTRTQHRMACNIEDAGFEIRDIVAWIYGSGFPKSLDISKQLDKMAGVEREVVGKRKETGPDFSDDQFVNQGSMMQTHSIAPRKQIDITAPSTAEAKQYDGWGTALKPSAEYWTIARKPLESRSVLWYNDCIKGVSKCLLQSFANAVEKSSKLNQQDQSAESNIVQWIAEKEINTSEDLFALMDTLQSCTKENTNLNIVLSWLNTLAEIWKVLNTSTTKTEINLTTELRILKSTEWENILANITLANNNQIDGLSANVCDVVSIFSVLKLKLKDTLLLIVQENASSVQLDPNVNMELWTLARKPIESTVASNVLKYGVGGLNIDGCRVGTELMEAQASGKTSRAYQSVEQTTAGGKGEDHQGRFPANVIHDGSDEVVKLFPNTSKGTSGGYDFEQSSNDNPSHVTSNIKSGVHFGDSGSAARFFYTAKAQRGERDMGQATVREAKITAGGMLCQDEIMELVELLRKVTSESTVKWNIDESGNSITAQCQVDSLFTTLMEIKKITPLKILPYLTPLLTNAFTLDANLLTVNGGNLVATAENSNEFQPIITNELTESARGASLAVWKTLQEISDAENWKVGRNTHSTVKPLDLMRYLVRLITPKGGIVLDPYLGSGTTAVAAKLEGMQYIGMEREPQYILIAEGRVKECESDYKAKSEMYENPEVKQVYDIFDYIDTK